MTEDQLEKETLCWLADIGYTVLHGVDIAPDGGNPERTDYRQVVLVERLRNAVNKLNPPLTPCHLKQHTYTSGYILTY